MAANIIALFKLLDADYSALTDEELGSLIKALVKDTLGGQPLFESGFEEICLANLKTAILGL